MRIKIFNIDLNSIKEAQKLMPKSSIRKVDLIRSNTFSEICCNNIFLKLECYQKTGSFKVRGAATMIERLSDQEKRNGVVAASAGNHAQGVAYASSMNKMACTIVMPKNASPAKIAATKSYGANVILEGNNYDESSDYAYKVARLEGKTLIPAFDHPDIIAGQGTVGLEILEDLREIDEIYVPIGGGGLIAGTAIAVKSMNPKIKVIGVESVAYPSMKQSIKMGKICNIQNGYTIADGISVKSPGRLTFELIKKYVDDVVVVDDLSIVKTMFLLMERSKIVTEPAGAASLAYIISNRQHLSKHKNIVSILSGGNVDMYLLGQVVAKGLMQTGRMIKLFIELRDRPGELKNIVDEIAKANVNIVEVVHDRLSSNISAGTAGVYLSLELENREQSHVLIKLFDKHKIKYKLIE
ncbi:L-threonine ammonia-lyase [Candidatus Nitrosocosmicus franklandus]|uniref:threonine ammonia-lyase n=2 Tax=Candidatus Nitrosocosmicus franklandianus TaxID=1798806 RepID=A0A484I999_9ARCH|nr:threonine ammonia-lyase [Candidatus Nitrosocosmicus franklandus]VFJ12562.1 L-threonine ammonia-lyase [Candidatus Nitrosocosmicus franklandus]